MTERRGRRARATPHSTPELLAALKFFSTQGMKSNSQVHFIAGRAIFDTSQARYFRYLPGIDWRITLDGHKLLKTIEKQTQQLTFNVSSEFTKLTVTSPMGVDALSAAPFNMVTAEPVFAMQLPEGAQNALVLAGELGKACGSPVHLRQGKLVIPSPRTGFIALLASDLPDYVPSRELGSQALARIGKMKAALAGLGPVRGNEAALALFFGTPSDASAMQIGLVNDDPSIDQIRDFLLKQDALKGCASEVPVSFWQALEQLRENAQDDLCRFESDTEPTVCSGEARRAVAIPVPAGAYFSLESLMSLKNVAQTVEFEYDNGWQVWFRGPFGLIGCLRSIAIGDVDSPRPLSEAEEAAVEDAFIEESLIP